MSQSVEEQIADQGYGIIPRFVDQPRVEQLSLLCEQMVEPREAIAVDGRTITIYRSPYLFTRTRQLDDLIIDSRLLSAFSSIIGYTRGWGMNLSDTSIKYLVPGQGPRSLHRDDDIYPQLSRDRAFTGNALLAIDPFNEAVGATTVVPGSHRWEHAVQEDHETLSIEMDPGDLLILNGRTWHGHGPNTSADQRRRAFNFYVCAGWLQPGHDPLDGLTAETVATLPDALKALITTGLKGPDNERGG
jgi:ectoine hydroxylase-related dioxygenase (phytanoyl-CoA dioxygenase family)